MEQGQAQALQVGQLRICEVSSLAALARCSGAACSHSGVCDEDGAQPRPAACQSGDAESVDATEAQFLLVLQLEGTSIHRQDERDAKLSPGDFTICSSTRPHHVDLPQLGRYLTVSIPDALIRRHLTCPEDVVAVRMSGTRGMTSVLSNFIRTFWTCRNDAIDPTVSLRMSYILLDLIAAAYSVTPHTRHEHSSLVAAHRARITAYIEAHLRDPNLNPTTVARACKITARYLHHLFTSESETVTQYIQRRRLEECARALIAAPLRTRLVTDIAFDYGFNSLTHFGRVFRHQYGLTPSEYRRTANRQLLPTPTPPTNRLGLHS